MTYDEFKQLFSEEFLKIKSFTGRIQYANQNLRRIGSGSGRAVYDIDGTKVLKLALNAKGIAQNEEESRLGQDYYIKYIVTEVFESANDDTWIIAEEAKKVTEKRIKELTGISSLLHLNFYLRNFENEQNGRRGIFTLDDDITEQLDENEFVDELKALITGYNQESGDMSRPSTYGEVLRNGQPTIVLTDYGLSKDVYQSHYSPARKQKQRMYELYNFDDGNDDILSDIGNTWETRHGIGLSSYGVDDNVANEGYIKFISEINKYPNKPIKSLPYLTDMFHECINNLDEMLNKANDKKLFYNNLINLQEYLIEQGFYNRDRINEVETESQPTDVEIDIINEYDGGLLNKYVADKIVNQITNRFSWKYGKPQYIDSGSNGAAYDIGSNKILKIIRDKSEAVENLELKGKSLKHIATPYNVFKIVSKSAPNMPETYGIVLEKLKTDSENFKRYIDRLIYVFENIFNESLYEIFNDYIIFNEWTVGKDKIDSYMSKNPDDAKFFNGLVNIADELKQHNINTIEFIVSKNLGYKPDGSLGFFDVGFVDDTKQPSVTPKEVTVDEDATAKFTTDNSIGQDDFPIHDNNDTSPSIQNDLNANSNLYNEDLEYSHASDATKDEYNIDERILSSMAGSSTVDVKKKCRLGGLGNTSAACNQGDINNLNIKPLNETSIDSISFDNIVTPQYIKSLEMSDGYERYLEYFKYEHGLEDQENDELEQHPELKNWLRNALYDRYEEAYTNIYNKIKSDNTIDIWRKMTVDQEWLERLPYSGKHLGIYWSWDERAAEAHWGQWDKQKILIKSSVREEYINWHDTIMLNMDISLGEEEKEIRLFKNTRLKIEELYIDGENIMDTPKGNELKNKTFLAEDEIDINNLDIKPLNEDIKPLNEDIIPNNKTFWAWVSPSNKFFEVPKFQHTEFIMKQYPQSLNTTYAFNDAFRDGWVRVIFEIDKTNYQRQLGINGYNKKRVISVFKNMFYDLIKYGKNSITLDYENPEGYDVLSTGDSDSNAKLINYLYEGVINKPVSKRKSLRLVLNGKQDYGIFIIDKNIYKRIHEKLLKKSIGILPIEMITNQLMEVIIYQPRAKNDAEELRRKILASRNSSTEINETIDASEAYRDSGAL